MSSERWTLRNSFGPRVCNNAAKTGAECCRTKSIQGDSHPSNNSKWIKEDGKPADVRAGGFGVHQEIFDTLLSLSVSLSSSYRNILLMKCRVLWPCQQMDSEYISFVHVPLHISKTNMWFLPNISYLFETKSNFFFVCDAIAKTSLFHLIGIKWKMKLY